MEQRTFVQESVFSKQWDALGFTDDNLRELEHIILANPEVGDLIVNTGGIRKMRYAYQGKGKSGGVRVCYVDFEVYETTHMLIVYAKSAKETLSDDECKYLKQLVKNLKDYDRRNYHG